MLLSTDLRSTSVPFRANEKARRDGYAARFSSNAATIGPGSSPSGTHAWARQGRGAPGLRFRASVAGRVSTLRPVSEKVKVWQGKVASSRDVVEQIVEIAENAAAASAFEDSTLTVVLNYGDGVAETYGADWRGGRARHTNQYGQVRQAAVIIEQPAPDDLFPAAHLQIQSIGGTTIRIEAEGSSGHKTARAFRAAVHDAENRYQNDQRENLAALASMFKPRQPAAKPKQTTVSEPKPGPADPRLAAKPPVRGAQGGSRKLHWRRTRTLGRWVNDNQGIVGAIGVVIAVIATVVGILL